MIGIISLVYGEDYREKSINLGHGIADFGEEPIPHIARLDRDKVLKFRIWGSDVHL